MRCVVLHVHVHVDVCECVCVYATDNEVEGESGATGVGCAASVTRRMSNSDAQQIRRSIVGLSGEGCSTPWPRYQV